MKKFLIILGIMVLIILLIPVVYILYEFSDDKDFCLDTSICKEGLELNTEYGLIKINKENCLKCKGKWDDKTRYCNMR